MDDSVARAVAVISARSWTAVTEVLTDDPRHLVCLVSLKVYDAAGALVAQTSGCGITVAHAVENAYSYLHFLNAFSDGPPAAAHAGGCAITIRSSNGERFRANKPVEGRERPRTRETGDRCATKETFGCSGL